MELVCRMMRLLLLLCHLCSVGAMNMCFVFFSHCDNNLEYLMVQDVNELLANSQALANNGFQVWLLQDRHSGSAPSDGHTNMAITGHNQEYTGAVIYKYNRQTSRLEVQTNFGEVNVDDPSYFKNFMVQAFQDCQSQGADTYSVILSNHGGGWYGFGGDENVRRLLEDPLSRRLGGQGMTLAVMQTAIAGALSDVGIAKLDLLGFDACLMAEYSALASFHELARYYIASEATEPGHGWDYAFIDPSVADVSAFAIKIIDGFSDGKHGYYYHQEPKTLALYDMSKFIAFRTAARTAFNKMINALASGNDRTLNTAIARARQETTEFMGVAEYGSETKGIADMLLFLQKLKTFCDFPELDSVMTTLNDMTVHYKQGPGTPDATGLGIFFPRKRYATGEYYIRSRVYPKSTYQGRTDQYTENWNDFIAAYYSFSSSSSSDSSICGGGSGGGSNPVPAPTPAPTPPPGVRVTLNGCACRKEWTLRGYDTCYNWCCNVDSDPGGDWCFVEDSVCEGANWAYCRAVGGPSTTPSLADTTTTEAAAGTTAASNSACVDSAVTGFTVSGQAATCTQLADYCQDETYGRQIRTECPVTCNACCVTMVSESGVAAGTACAEACQPDTAWGPYGWCWTSVAASEWGSCALSCWPDGFTTTTGLPTTAMDTTTAALVDTTTPVSAETTTVETTTLVPTTAAESTTPSACDCVAVQHPTFGYIPAACLDHLADDTIWCYVPINAACNPPASPSSSVQDMAWITCATADTTMMAAQTTPEPTTTMEGAATTAPPAGACVDSADPGYTLDGNPATCIELRFHCQHSEVGADISRLCPVSCNACGCSDSETFTDKNGNACSYWVDKTCSSAEQLEGFNHVQQQDLLANCRKACGLCSAGGETDSCQWAKDGECDVPTFCDYGTDCTDCGTCDGQVVETTTTVQAGTTSPGAVDDSCVYSHDGMCDEPTYCAVGTDCTDCATCAGVASDTCRWARDGVCDEPYVCGPGTDCSDCGNCDSTWQPADNCYWALDGECDEPTYCNFGTDCTDCQNCDQANQTSQTGQTTTLAAATQPSALDNSCYRAYDGVCQGSDVCLAGTDCSDCGTCTLPGASLDSCHAALDGWCDEPLNCGHGTDCSDCGRCAAPPSGCVCKAVNNLPARCGDLAGDNSRPWCYVEDSNTCESQTRNGEKWVTCEATGPGGHKETGASANWKPPEGCSCLGGHPVAPTCLDRLNFGTPWCYVDPAGACVGMRKDFVGTFVECQRVGREDESGQPTSAPSSGLGTSSSLLSDVRVTERSAGGFEITAGLSPLAAEVKVLINLVYRTTGLRRLEEANTGPQTRRMEDSAENAVVHAIEVQSHFTAGGFRAEWDGQVLYLQQGNTKSKAHFQPEGANTVSVGVVYFPLGVTPHYVGGWYSSTGGRPGRLTLGIGNSEDAALYVEDGDLGQVSAIGRQSGGYIAPVLSLREHGWSLTLLETLFAWGSPPEVPEITVQSFSLTASEFPIPFEIAAVGVYADQDPPVSDFWEDHRLVELDARGAVNTGASFSCTSHLDCGEQHYCWDCDRCIALSSPDFCLNCISGRSYCGEKKFCDCASGQKCDSTDLKCPGVPQLGKAVLVGAQTGEWVGSEQQHSTVQKVFTEHAKTTLGLSTSTLQWGFKEESGAVVVTATAEDTKVPTFGASLSATAITQAFADKGVTITPVTDVQCSGCVACAISSSHAQAESHSCVECQGTTGCTLALDHCTPACKAGFAPEPAQLMCQDGAFEALTYTCVDGASQPQEEPKASITGNLGLSVSDPASFVSSASARLATRRALASTTNSSEDSITITRMTVARRLQVVLPRQLSGSVNVEYTVSVPVSQAQTVSEQITAAPSAGSGGTSQISAALTSELTNLGLGSITAEVSSATVTETVLPTTTTALDQTTVPPDTTTSQQAASGDTTTEAASGDTTTQAASGDTTTQAASVDTTTQAAGGAADTTTADVDQVPRTDTATTAMATSAIGPLWLFLLGLLSIL